MVVVDKFVEVEFRSVYWVTAQKPLVLSGKDTSPPAWCDRGIPLWISFWSGGVVASRFRTWRVIRAGGNICHVVVGGAIGRQLGRILSKRLDVRADLQRESRPRRRLLQKWLR